MINDTVAVDPVSTPVKTAKASQTNVQLFIIIISSVVAFVLIISVLLLLKTIFQRRKTRRSLLPTTEQPPSQSGVPFLQGHLAALRAWQKPIVPSLASNSSQATQKSDVIEMAQVSLQTPPMATHNPYRKPMTYKDFVK